MKKPEKLSQPVINLLLPRLQDEFNAAYFYRSASNWCKNVGYFKAGAFFDKESEDEFGHAKKIENYLVDWNITPALPTIPKPTLDFASIEQVIIMAYEMEYDLYENYEDTSMKIFKTGDLCVFDFLQQYRTGQKDAVAEYSDKLNMLEGTNTSSKFEMLMLEEKLFG
jgi:ferritin